MTVNISVSAAQGTKTSQHDLFFMERVEYETKLTKIAETVIREIMRGNGF